MSRETRIAIEHSTPMPQHSESGVSARYESKVFSLWDREAWAKLTPFPDEIGWIQDRQCSRSCKAL